MAISWQREQSWNRCLGDFFLDFWSRKKVTPSLNSVLLLKFVQTSRKTNSHSKRTQLSDNYLYIKILPFMACSWPYPTIMVHYLMVQELISIYCEGGGTQRGGDKNWVIRDGSLVRLPLSAATYRQCSKHARGELVKVKLLWWADSILIYKQSHIFGIWAPQTENHVAADGAELWGDLPPGQGHRSKSWGGGRRSRGDPGSHGC